MVLWYFFREWYCGSKCARGEDEVDRKGRVPEEDHGAQRPMDARESTSESIRTAKTLLFPGLPARPAPVASRLSTTITHTAVYVFTVPSPIDPRSINGDAEDDDTTDGQSMLPPAPPRAVYRQLPQLAASTTSTIDHIDHW